MLCERPTAHTSNVAGRRAWGEDKEKQLKAGGGWGKAGARQQKPVGRVHPSAVRTAAASMPAVPQGWL